MAGGFCRGKVAYAVESEIFSTFSRSDRPEISIRQKLNKEQMEISGRPCRKKSSWYMMNVSERQKMETINTPYDDTFRTLLQNCERDGILTAEDMQKRAKPAPAQPAIGPSSEQLSAFDQEWYERVKRYTREKAVPS